MSPAAESGGRPPGAGLWAGWLRYLWPSLLVWAIFVGVLVASLAVAIGASRRVNEQRFRSRTASSAALVGQVLSDQESIGRVLAEDLLSARHMRPGHLRPVVSSLGYAAGGVFDRTGHLLVGLPYIPEFVGQDFTQSLEHVRMAVLHDRPAVSQVIISPAFGTPVVGIAIPFESPPDRRILTGVFRLQDTEQFDRVIEGAMGREVSDVYLLDRDGNLIASTRAIAPEITPLASMAPALGAAVAEAPAGTYSAAGTRRVYASGRVPGTAWSVVADVDAAELEAPTNALETTSKALGTAIGAGGLGVAILFGLAGRRRRLAEEETRRLNVDLEARVASRTASLEMANRDLESFGYSVSHDLRAPLRAIEGFAGILEAEHAERLDREGRRVLGVITSSTRRMGDLIEGLLRFSRAPRRELDLRRVDMTAVAHAVVEEARALEPERAVHVEVDDLPPALADEALIRGVLANLVSNAFKFTRPSPEPRVEIGWRRDGDRDVYVVRDNGVGYDERYADKLFQVFQRLHRRDEFEGAGIGLALAQRIVERHGGRMGSASTLGEGAEFWFSLPAPGIGSPIGSSGG